MKSDDAPKLGYTMRPIRCNYCRKFLRKLFWWKKKACCESCWKELAGKGAG